MEIDSWLMEILPYGYDYIAKECTKNDEQLTATLRVNIFSKENAVQWRSEFEEISKGTFSVSKTFLPGDKVLFKKDYRCHHNTRANSACSKTKTPSAKHTNCPARLKITLKNPKMKRSKDEHLKTHPCEIYIKNNHNHPIERSDLLRYRKPNKNTVEKVLKLFQQGYSPSAALKLLKCELQEQHGKDYLKYASDGSLCPSLPWMYHFYYSTFKKKCRESKFHRIKTIEITENDQNVNSESEDMEVYDSVEYAEEIVEETENKENIARDDISPVEFVEDTVEETGNNENDTRDNAMERLNNVVDVLKNHLEDPEILNAVETFLDNFDKIETKEELVSSLTTFGIS